MTGTCTVLSRMVLIAALCGSAEASLMAIWDFGPNASGFTLDATRECVVGLPSLYLFGGEIDINGKDGTEFIDTWGRFHPVGQAAAWEDVKVTGLDAEWVLRLNTTGWKDLTMRWDYRSAETPTIDLAYRIGGTGGWMPILNNSYIVADNAWHVFSVDLSLVNALENQEIVELRFSDLARSGNGKFRFDNLELTGVPEPGTLALFGIGGLSLIFQCRRTGRNVAQRHTA